MPANQIYVPVRGLHRDITPQPGGLYRIYFAVIEDLVTMPAINPATGIMDQAAIVLAAGKSWYVVNAAHQRSYREEPKSGDDGPYIETTVTGVVPFASTQNHLTLDRLKYHRFIVIAERPDHSLRVIGSADNPARLTHVTDMGAQQRDPAGSTVSFIWTSEDKPVIYQGAITPVVIT